MRKLSITLAIAAFASGAHAQMTLLSNFAANQAGGFSAGEIVSFDKNTDRLYVTSSGSNVYGINVFDISNPSTPSQFGSRIDFSTTFGLASDMLSLTSVAIDPLSRFGVATLVPTANTTTLGRIGYFSLITGSIFGTAAVGYHPDSVTFSADGSKIVVSNEAEFNPASGTNANGSISIIDVSGINGGNLGTLPSAGVTTKDFGAGNLDTGVSIASLRNSNLAALGLTGSFNQTVPVFNTAAPEAMEPEYATISGNKVFVSLQDNNAIAEYDLTSNLWTKVTNLGSIVQTIDATDTGSSINITKNVRGLFMPDTIGSYVVGGTTYVITANEGDARGDDRDVSRFGDISGNDSLNPLIDTDAPSNFLLTGSGERANSELGRLNISRIDGDTDADGKIDDPTMIGTRSFSVWASGTGGLTRVYDSGSFFETYIATNDASGWVDSRSDDKGPEPEGLTLGTIAGKEYLFISMERTNSIFMFDVSIPTAPVFFDYIRISSGSIPQRPEGMTFISAADSPTGVSLLVVGFEGDGNSATNERVAIFSVVPEPTTGLLLVLGGAACLLRRRRA